MIETVWEPELRRLILGEEAENVGIPSGTAEENVSSDFGSIFQANEVVIKFENIFSIDLNILRYCLPEIGVLNESESIVGPENT